jgi:hypothetical protein
VNKMQGALGLEGGVSIRRSAQVLGDGHPALRSCYAKFRASLSGNIHEGLVSKHRDRPYQGGRSKFWVKTKNRKHPAMDRVMESFR